MFTDDAPAPAPTDITDSGLVLQPEIPIPGSPEVVEIFPPKLSPSDVTILPDPQEMQVDSSGDNVVEDLKAMSLGHDSAAHSAKSSNN